MAAPAQKPADSADLVYRLEDKPPFMNALLSAITHLLAIFVPMITPALIVGGALQLPVEMTAYLVSMAMVASAKRSSTSACKDMGCSIHAWAKAGRRTSAMIDSRSR